VPSLFHQRARCRPGSPGPAGRPRSPAVRVPSDDRCVLGRASYLPAAAAGGRSCCRILASPSFIPCNLQTLPARVPFSFVRSAAAFRGKCACALGKAKRSPASIWIDRSIDPCKLVLFLSSWCLRFAILTSQLARTLPNACLYQSSTVRACVLCDQHYPADSAICTHVTWEGEGDDAC
jgi:hypothetical protein